MKPKWLKKSVHIVLVCYSAILLTVPHIQAQSPSVNVRSDQGGFDPTVNLNMAVSFTKYVDPVGGMSVEEIAQKALAHNAELLAARQRVTEAQGLLVQAKFRPNPGIEISVSNGSILGSPGERELTLGYAHTFELGGKRERRMEVAQLGIELAQLEIAERERQLTAEIKARYGEALAAARNLEIAERLLALNQHGYQITVARVREGEAAPFEQGLLQVEVGRLDADRLVLENHVARAILELKTLAGMNLDEALRLSGDLSMPPVRISLAEATERALAERPELKAARVEEQRADAELRLARAEAIPNLIGFARYTRVNSRFDQFGLSGAGTLAQIRDADNVFTAGVSITLPMRNRNQGSIQAAVARRQAAALRRQFIEQVVRREVRAAYSRCETARQALDVFNQRILKQSQENVSIIRAGYNLGELRLLDVINEQRRLIDTQKAYTEALKEYYLALVELERAVGAPIR
ncbi:MAG: TolC family protein [Acidobacteriota bacterium]|nr:TolC family protein [Blastocatellia bacterium]MDW8239754.1 TolC family protein [Acidobacteriota bacterium]